MTKNRAISIKILLILLFTLASGVVVAQTHFYKGNSSYSSDILYTWDGKSLYRGNSTYSSDILYTFDGKHVYRGRSSYFFWPPRKTFVFLHHETGGGRVLRGWRHPSDSGISPT